MTTAAKDIRGYSFGASTVAVSPVSMADLHQLKMTVGLTEEDERFLKLAGQVLADQTRQIVEHWRSGIIANIPHLARHSKSPDGTPIPQYLAQSNRRFEQWILDTCVRPYDQNWLNYQHEIALRHTSVMKNKTDGVDSTPFVPFRDIIGFVAVMNETMKAYLSAKGHMPEDVNQMHQAWCKSLQLQLALWARTYTDLTSPGGEW